MKIVDLMECWIKFIELGWIREYKFMFLVKKMLYVFIV